MKPPAWVRIADALSVTALVLTLSILLFGGMATWVGPIRVSARSPFRALLVALAIIIFRHAAYRADPLHARIRRGLAAAAERPAWGAVAIALTSRVAVIAVALFAVLTIGPLTGAIGFAVSDDPLENLQARFDAGWYGGIAQDGYAFDGDYDRQQNIAFFPAFPMAMRAAGAVVGGFNPHRDRWWRKTRLLWAGATVSMLAFAGGCLYLLRIARISGLEARGLDAVALMAAYPFAAYYSAAYTEGLFLLASAGAFYHFATRQWSRAFAWGLVVGLTRPNGCFLSVALAVMAAEEAWRARRAAGGEAYPWLPAVLAASGAGLGLIAYSVFVGRLTGDWLAWAHIQRAWGRSFVGLSPIARGIGWVDRDGLLRVFSNIPIDTLNALAVIFAASLLWPVWRRLGSGWAVFVLLNAGLPFIAGGVLSLGRMTSTLFPIFLALAAVLPRRAVMPLVVAFAIAQGLIAVLFYTWRPMF